MFTSAHSTRDFVLHIAGGFSVDAIVRADGSFETDRLGGNALWAAMGAHMSGTTPGLHAVVGRDYPLAALERLAELGFDISGVRRSETGLGVRVTFSYAADGSRIQPATVRAVAGVPEPYRARFIDTTRMPDELLQALPTAEELHTEETSGWHLGLLPSARFRELVWHLSGASAYLQVDCPARFELRRDGLGVLGETLDQVDVFLPSTSDTDVFAPGLGRVELINRFHDLGARTVVLKCAEDGALVSEAAGTIWHVPSHIESAVVDPTGAGDVFAGAFAAFMSRGRDLIESVSAAAAAASLSVTRRSPFDLVDIDPVELHRRRKRIAREVAAI